MMAITLFSGKGAEAGDRYGNEGGMLGAYKRKGFKSRRYRGGFNRVRYRKGGIWPGKRVWVVCGTMRGKENGGV